MAITVTEKGYKKIVTDLEKLKKVDRPEIITLIEHIRTNGGGELLENSEFTNAQTHQAMIETKIQNLEATLSDLKIVNPADYAGNTKIMFGATVTLLDEDTEEKITYQIVSEYESDVRAGFISVSSPVGKSLINKTVGDTVTVITPRTDKYFEILDVVYK